MTNIYGAFAFVDKLMLDKETDWGLFLPKSIEDKVRWVTYKTKPDQWEFDGDTGFLLSLALSFECSPEVMADYTLASKKIMGAFE